MAPKAEDLDSPFAHLPTTPSTFPLVEGLPATASAFPLVEGLSAAQSAFPAVENGPDINLDIDGDANSCKYTSLASI